MPTSEPPANTISIQNSVLMRGSCPGISFFDRMGQMKMEEAIQQIEIQYSASIRCQLRDMVTGKTSDGCMPNQPRKLTKSLMVMMPLSTCTKNRRMATAKNL
ncbi:MAG: hypothetical protein IPM82_30905 [Saprospiraceae bacterium]|nr:hypothetical protein [Saprospiraceae bacterium]